MAKKTNRRRPAASKRKPVAAAAPLAEQPQDEIVQADVFIDVPEDDGPSDADVAKERAAKNEQAAAEVDEATFIRTAVQRYERGYQRDRENIEQAYEDLEFRAGNQWTDEEKKDRDEEGRPCLTINRMGQFVRQVTGDIRQMRPAVKVSPVDDNGDPDTAKVLGGMIRYIENRSYARKIYAATADSQVAAGIGHWKIISEYASAGSFNQELRIVQIEDGLSVIWDPDSLMPTREDAMWCFVPTDMSKDTFEAKWPGVSEDSIAMTPEVMTSGWYGEDYVRVAEYWVKKPTTVKMALLEDGSVVEFDSKTDEEKAELLLAGARVEDRETFKVCRYLITGSKILEGPEEWPGRHIPVVPVIGEEIKIGRRIVRHGIIRFARDPQRMYNYFRSAQTETVALQPKAPFIGTEEHFKKHKNYWEQANTRNFPYLPYSPDPKAPQSRPERVAPPVNSAGITEGVLQASDDMKAVTGLYDASLGQRSNETSGKAIEARQREGDVGSFVYLDNFSMAVQRTGEILIDLIPHIYDTQRTIRIVGEDGKTDVVKINRPVMLNGVKRVLNDVTTGAYDVSLEIGASYSTRREQAKEGMREFMQASPDMAPILGDLYAKAQDWPMADEIGERLEAMLPPQIQEKMKAKGEQEIGQKLPGEGEPGQAGAQAQMTPEQMREAMAMEAEQKALLLQQQMAEAQAEAAIAEATAKAAKAEADAKAAAAKALQEEIKLEQMRLELSNRIANPDGFAPPTPAKPTEKPAANGAAQ